jgi:hypothetical protein
VATITEKTFDKQAMKLTIKVKKNQDGKEVKTYQQ